MAMFGRTGGDSPTPLSRDRIEAWMKEQEFNYRIDDDGDIGGYWGENLFFFMVQGQKQEILFVQSRWHGELPAIRRIDLLEGINDWSKRTRWPKAYISDKDNGQITVMAEHSYDLEDGVTAAQLSRFLRCALGTSMQLYEELDEKFGAQQTITYRD